MTFFTFPPPEEKMQHHKHQDDLIVKVKPTEKLRRKPRNNELKPNPKPPSSWDSFKNILTCKRADVLSAQSATNFHGGPPSQNTRHVLGSCGSICSFRDVVVVHGGNAGSSRRVVHRSDDESLDHSRSLAHRETSRLPSKKNGSRRDGGGSSSRWSLASSSSRRMHLRKLSGCYECQAIVDPTRYPMPRTTICTCPDCGDVFPKIESLEHHRAVRHAVTELGPDDSSRNIVEIIFKSSWLKNDTSVCNIQRILKVHNTPRTIQRFEDYRDAVKLRAAVLGKKNPRCAADGNELLRFYCTTLTCALGASGSSSLCGSFPGCRACTIIRHGFHGNKPCGIRTTDSSGRAHDSRRVGGDRHMAILVCRVIAGRVGRIAEETAAGDEEASLSLSASAAAEAGSFDSVAEVGGSDPNLEELYVFNPRAILPCFVVIYKAMES